VEHQPTTEQSTLTTKYSEELIKMHNKPENLPIGHGDPNT
jgi:hypothetical protein